MKKLNLLGLLCVSFTMLFTGCSKDEPEEIQALRLSTDDQAVYTDAIEYSFDIVSGGGGYQVEVTKNSPFDLGGKATLTGSRVKVDLVSNATHVIVTDKYGQEANLIIWSRHESLQTVNHTISVSYGNYLKTNMNWGAGNYSVLKQFGDAATLTFDGNHLIAQSLHPGRTTFLVRDERGTTNSVAVTVGDGWDLNEKELTVTALAGYYYTFPLRYGDGGWKITSRPAALSDVWTVIMPKDQYRAHDMLQIFAPEGHPEPLVLQLKDKAGHTATITILSK